MTPGSAICGKASLMVRVFLSRVWDEEPFDAIPFYTAMEYLKEREPRVLFASFGETHDWALRATMHNA